MRFTILLTLTAVLAVAVASPIENGALKREEAALERKENGPGKSWKREADPEPQYAPGGGKPWKREAQYAPGGGKPWKREPQFAPGGGKSW
ncbi:hypothetical protein CPB85DRAFT_1437440 [Mucidula mucida]|nr:hypothetical protein CPB85DRAFT_1437440 [Mucidula mucida]